MPYVNIKITREGNVTPEQKQALIEGATNLLHDVLGKNKKTTVVVIDEVDTDNWGIGGISVTEIRSRLILVCILISNFSVLFLIF